MTKHRGPNTSFHALAGITALPIILLSVALATPKWLIQDDRMLMGPYSMMGMGFGFDDSDMEVDYGLFYTCENFGYRFCHSDLEPYWGSRCFGWCGKLRGAQALGVLSALCAVAAAALLGAYGSRPVNQGLKIAGAVCLYVSGLFSIILVGIMADIRWRDLQLGFWRYGMFGSPLTMGMGAFAPPFANWYFGYSWALALISGILCWIIPSVALGLDAASHSRVSKKKEVVTVYTHGNSQSGSGYVAPLNTHGLDTPVTPRDPAAYYSETVETRREE